MRTNLLSYLAEGRATSAPPRRAEKPSAGSRSCRVHQIPIPAAGGRRTAIPRVPWHDLRAVDLLGVPEDENGPEPDIMDDVEPAGARAALATCEREHPFMRCFTTTAVSSSLSSAIAPAERKQTATGRERPRIASAANWVDFERVGGSQLNSANGRKTNLQNTHPLRQFQVRDFLLVFPQERTRGRFSRPRRPSGQVFQGFWDVASGKSHRVPLRSAIGLSRRVDRFVARSPR